MDKELALKEPQHLSNLGEVQQFAENCFKSGLFPDCKSPAEAFMKAVAGRELGLPALMSLQKLYIVNGRMGMAGEVAIVLLQRASYKIEHKYDSRDNPTACEVTLTHPQKGSFTWRFTIADARRAGLVKPNSAWEKFPQDLLYYRALMSAARKFAPEALGGIGYTPEELQSIIIEPVESGVKPASIIDTLKEHGAVIIPDMIKTYPKLIKLYPELSLENCWEHSDAWVDGEYGKYHRMPKGSCYLRNKVRDMAMELVPKHLGFNTHEEPKARKDGKMIRYLTNEFKDWLKRDREIEDWNKTNIEKQLEVLESLIGE